MSLYVTISINKSNKIKPNAFTIFDICGLMGDPLITSINKKNNRPPSRAGMGSKFNIAKFMEIIATVMSNETKPFSACSPTIVTMPTGPETSAKSAVPKNMLEKKSTRPRKMNLV